MLRGPPFFRPLRIRPDAQKAGQGTSLADPSFICIVRFLAEKRFFWCFFEKYFLTGAESGGESGSGGTIIHREKIRGTERVRVYTLLLLYIYYNDTSALFYFVLHALRMYIIYVLIEMPHGSSRAERMMTPFWGMMSRRLSSDGAAFLLVCACTCLLLQDRVCRWSKWWCDGSKRGVADGIERSDSSWECQSQTTIGTYMLRIWCDIEMYIYYILYDACANVPQWHHTVALHVFCRSHSITPHQLRSRGV